MAIAVAGKLVLRGVSKTFTTRADPARWWRKEKTLVVNDVSLVIRTGEVLALVGESGSGKTTTALMAMRLVEPTAGDVKYSDDETGERRQSRFEFSRRVQIVFQDPAGALNPRQSVREILTRPLMLHRGHTSATVLDDVVKLLERVGLVPAELYFDRFPHQLSGGQKQRLCIARAISVQARILIADEPVSSLDVSVQGQILQLLLRLKDEDGIGILLISHDLAVVRAVADRVAVMHRGRIVETGETDAVLGCPRDPYTQLLLASVPVLET